MSARRQTGGVVGALPAPAPGSDIGTSLDDVIAGLVDLDLKGLRLQWRNHLGGTPPAHLLRWLLLRVLAYQIQVAALGGPRQSDTTRQSPTEARNCGLG